MGERPYQICTKCIMDTSDPNIIFDDVGVCDYCRNFEAVLSPKWEADKADPDPQAIALGYKHDTTKVDPKKYPKHAVAQKCSNCPLFQGKAGDAWGPCPLFAGKQVTAAGWCSAWTGKAA